MRILIIEDNQKLLRNLVEILSTQEFNVSTAETGTAGMKKALREEYDLIVLDLNLPDIDGIKVCKILREKSVNIPILMLTARIDLESKVSGLDTGADDYLTKPFESEELLARVRALLRRNSNTSSSIISIQDYTIDLKAQRISNLNGAEIKLSTTEFRIIEYLINNKGKVCSALDIYQSVWGDEADNLTFSDTLKVHIARIRSKLPKDFITTIIGSGYIIK